MNHCTCNQGKSGDCRCIEEFPKFNSVTALIACVAVALAAVVSSFFPVL